MTMRRKTPWTLTAPDALASDQVPTEDIGLKLPREVQWPLLAPLALLLGAVLWSLWPALSGMAERWSGDPRYAHGYLVPMFSLALLWMRREQFLGETFRPSTWGLVFLLLGA